MAKREGWLGRLGNKLNRMEARLNERRAEVEAETRGTCRARPGAGGRRRVRPRRSPRRPFPRRPPTRP